MYTDNISFQVKTNQLRNHVSVFSLVISCAPVLTGIKSAATYTWNNKDKESRQILKNILNCFHTKQFVLFKNSDHILYMVYQEKRLENVLADSQIKKFLFTAGYRDFTVNSMLSRLKERFLSYKTGTMDFPHEIGLFLEYPYEDVLGFIKHKGKWEKCNGYFKVYSDVERAKRIFSAYDQARIYLGGILT